ncbi:MAG: DegV family protein [Anaerolineales bacterium]
MSEIQVVTDSVAQIPPKLAEHHHIGIIPFSIIINDKSYLDGENIRPTELYRRMRTEDIVPRTSHPSMGEYIQLFKKYLDKDAQAVLYLTLSGKLSGAFSTATKAALQIEKELPGKKVAVFDTRTATIAQGFVAISAAQAAQSGPGLDHVINTAQEVQSKVGFVAMLETLTYLARGGRVGKAAYLVGSLIQIKPVVTINKEGVVTPLVNLRGKKKCVGKLVDCMANTIGNRKPTQIAVMHADDMEKAEELSQQARERFGVTEIMFTDFTPVMGAHAGPGVLGLGYTLE